MNIEGRSMKEIELLFEAALIKAGFAELERQEKIATDEWLRVSENRELTRSAYSQNYRRIHRNIRRTVDRRRVKRRLTVTAPKIAKIAVSIILVFNLGLTVAVATIEQVRTTVFNFLVSIEDEYTELELQKEMKGSAKIPAAWDGIYFPAYIPSGLFLASINPKTDATNGKVYYRNEDGSRWVIFIEYASKDRININTEGAKIEWYTINGMSVMLANRGTEQYATWSFSNSYFVVWTDGACEDILKIAESVKSTK